MEMQASRPLEHGAWNDISIFIKHTHTRNQPVNTYIQSKVKKKQAQIMENLSHLRKKNALFENSNPQVGEPQVMV